MVESAYNSRGSFEDSMQIYRAYVISTAPFRTRKKAVLKYGEIQTLFYSYWPFLKFLKL